MKIMLYFFVFYLLQMKNINFWIDKNLVFFTILMWETGVLTENILMYLKKNYFEINKI